MKYLCMVYQEESLAEALPPREHDAFRDDVRDVRAALRQNGHVIVSIPLQSVQTATTVRVRNGRVTVADGPYAQTKEHLGELYVIDARDLNHAIRVASKLPSARLGSIEVRPLAECDPD
jgi:hypothetical protein